MSETDKKDSPVIQIKVTVTTAVNPSTGQQEYVPKYNPEIIPVTESDTVLVFKLTKKTPDNVIITSVTPRQVNDQLSSPSISKNGRQVVLTDINTVRETINLKFEFGSKTSKSEFARMDCEEQVGDNYPEVLNEPP